MPQNALYHIDNYVNVNSESLKMSSHASVYLLSTNKNLACHRNLIESPCNVRPIAYSQYETITNTCVKDKETGAYDVCPS